MATEKDLFLNKVGFERESVVLGAGGVAGCCECVMGVERGSDTDREGDSA